jgi:cell division septation protein DedD
MTAKNRRVFELRLGKVGLIAFISGMSVMLFFMFLLGIIVGKHMEAYPERYSSGITDLIRDGLVSAVSKQGKVALPAADQDKKDAPAGGGADFGLTFYNTLGGKKAGAAAGSHAGATKYKPSAIPAGQASPAGSAAETGSPVAVLGGTSDESTPPVPGGEGEGAGTNPPPGGTPAEEGGMRKPPAGETELQGKGRFEVQVAAYRERSQAERLVKKITALGFSPRVVMKELPGKGRWFRVIVGGFESRSAAEQAAEQITGKINGLKFVIRSSDRDGNGG